MYVCFLMARAQLTVQAKQRPFRSVSIQSHKESTLRPRAYSLALAPDLIYTTSPLLKALVSARVDSQLEFKAVGSWFTYQRASHASPLKRVPESREDIFADTSLDIKTKGALVRVLRFLADYENKEDIWKADHDRPLSELLTSRFKLPPALQSQLLALTLSSSPEPTTPRSFAIARIANHLRSFNALGPGFNAVVPTYGGLCEIAQIACRASAVGGATYVLDCSVDEITRLDGPDARQRVKLSTGNTVTARHVVGTRDQLPAGVGAAGESPAETTVVSRSISIVDSRLSRLFAQAEGAPSPAAIVVIMPTAADVLGELGADTPVHIIIHSSDTGDCPAGQCKLLSLLPSTDEQPYEYLSTLTESLDVHNSDNLIGHSLHYLSSTVVDQADMYRHCLCVRGARYRARGHDPGASGLCDSRQCWRRRSLEHPLVHELRTSRSEAVVTAPG